MKYIELSNVPILEQLQLEEALLRTSNESWCIVNVGSPPAIVMGISGKAEELIDLERARIPIIRRYSGGGTVVVNEDTIFVSFLIQNDLCNVKPYPQPILEWSAGIYSEFLPELSARENDYVIGECKVGGNAQYLRKNCFVHHTTFLWDYDEALMDLLLLPKKRPEYRSDRSHSDFVTRLKHHIEKKDFTTQLKKTLTNRFNIKESNTPNSFPEHRKSTICYKYSTN